MSEESAILSLILEFCSLKGWAAKVCTNLFLLFKTEKNIIRIRDMVRLRN
jgi:hypothetical protein